MYWNRQKFLRLVSLTLLLLILPISIANAVEVWVRVATGGLGDPNRSRVPAMAIYGPHIYIASGSTSGPAQMFRATISEDEIWEEVTPPWAAFTFNDVVTDMIVVGNALFVSLDSTLGRQLWRLTPRGCFPRPCSPSHIWTDVTPTFSDSEDLHFAALGSVRQFGTSHVALCLARTKEGGGSIAPKVDVWCQVQFDDGGSPGWLRQFQILEPAGSGLIGVTSTHLHGFGGTLYLGFGGFSRMDRPCQVWKLPLVRVSSDDPIRVDGENCFGTGHGFMGAITDFNRRVYFGTAGGESAIFRTLGSGIEDVTPFPIRNITSFALVRKEFSGTRLYMGMGHFPHVGNAGVFFTETGGDWEESYFSPFENLVTSDLASHCAYLYAGTLNNGGFEVLRRTALLVDLTPCIGIDVHEAVRELGRLSVCVLTEKCPIDLDPFAAHLASIRDALESPRHPLDDLRLVDDGRAMMKEAFAEFQVAEELLLSQKEPSLPLALQGMEHLRTSARFATDTWVHLKTPLAEDGGANEPIFP